MRTNKNLETGEEELIFSAIIKSIDTNIRKTFLDKSYFLIKTEICTPDGNEMSLESILWEEVLNSQSEVFQVGNRIEIAMLTKGNFSGISRAQKSDENHEINIEALIKNFNMEDDYEQVDNNYPSKQEIYSEDSQIDESDSSLRFDPNNYTDEDTVEFKKKLDSGSRMLKMMEESIYSKSDMSKKEFYKNEIRNTLVDSVNLELLKFPPVDSHFKSILIIKTLGDTAESLKNNLGEIMYRLEGEQLFNQAQIEELLLNVQREIFDEFFKKKKPVKINFEKDQEVNESIIREAPSDQERERAHDLFKIVEEHRIRKKFIGKSNAPQSLTNLLTEQYFTHYFIETELNYSAKELITEFYLRDYGGKEVKHIDEIVSNYSDNLPLLILCVYSYDIMENKELSMELLHGLPVFYKIILETYNNVCPENMKIEYEFSKKMKNKILDFIN